MAKGSKSFKIGRNSKSGKLESVKKARSHPDTSVIEHMPKKGHGTEGKSGK